MQFSKEKIQQSGGNFSKSIYDSALPEFDETYIHLVLSMENSECKLLNIPVKDRLLLNVLSHGYGIVEEDMEIQQHHEDSTA
jgi:hypothetical protein